jgi:predicted PP-loop superfamily ATPase
MGSGASASVAERLKEASVDNVRLVLAELPSHQLDQLKSAVAAVGTADASAGDEGLLGLAQGALGP